LKLCHTFSVSEGPSLTEEKKSLVEICFLLYFGENCKKDKTDSYLLRSCTASEGIIITEIVHENNNNSVFRWKLFFVCLHFCLFPVNSSSNLLCPVTICRVHILMLNMLIWFSCMASATSGQSILSQNENCIWSFFRFSSKQSRNEHISTGFLFLVSPIHAPEVLTFKFQTPCIKIFVILIKYNILYLYLY